MILKDPTVEDFIDTIKLYMPKLTDEQAEKFGTDVFNFYTTNKKTIYQIIITCGVILITLTLLSLWYILRR